jgi:hypothetical protein
METILQGVLDLPGVGATMVFDGAGHLAGHRAHAVYDRALCEQVSGALVKAIETVQLQQEDWETVTAQFADGTLLLRSLGAGAGGAHYLAVIADGSLNPSFATVAIRVAANKLRKAIDGGASSRPGSSSASAPAAPAPGSSVHPGDSRPVVANSGVSWSKVSGSSVGLSRIAVADPASSAFLVRCTKELARHVGPIASVFVEEAVRRVSPEAPFAVALARPLLDDLAGQIEDAGDRARFRDALVKG